MEALMRLASTGGDEVAVVDALMRLASTGGDEVVDAVKARLDDPVGSVRRRAAEAMAEMAMLGG